MKPKYCPFCGKESQLLETTYEHYYSLCPSCGEDSFLIRDVDRSTQEDTE